MLLVQVLLSQALHTYPREEPFAEALLLDMSVAGVHEHLVDPEQRPALGESGLCAGAFCTLGQQLGLLSEPGFS
jgi:hypothetical protein